MIVVAAQIDNRLVMDLKAAFGDRSPQIPLEFAAQVGLRFHRRLEEAMGPAAGRLRRIHREIGALEQPEQVGAVTRRDGNADAGVAAEAVAEAIERRSQRPIDLHDQRLDIGVGDDVALQDGEFIAAEPRNKVARSDELQAAVPTRPSGTHRRSNGPASR